MPLLVPTLSLLAGVSAPVAAIYEGDHFSGTGDVEFLSLLDTGAAMFEPNPALPNLPMLYNPTWNGLVEGPTWGAWWIQNSYGPSYCALPFLKEPYTTFLQNSQDLWFSLMGTGSREGVNGWIAPDGCLCDAAAPGWIVYRQGDGRTDIHDWGMEFTAAGVVLQSELLLISRDAAAIEHYIPMLERSANFIESRRDPENDLFLAGPAGNLLAPSYAGWPRGNDRFDKAYLTGLSVTYIAALDRLIELEKLAGRSYVADVLTHRRDTAREGLKLVTTDEGYLIRSLDPDGTKHGVFGAEEHGYFEAPPNHDAICFRVVDDRQAKAIYAKMLSIPELRPNNLILPNYPGYDDMYLDPTGNWLWSYGTWVNGGHWTTCEARMLMADYRMGSFEAVRRSMRTMLDYAERWRFDNPLVDCGREVYQPTQPINVVYDSFGGPAGAMRGLFEYLYRADGLTLVPHIPHSITALEQHDPVRFGEKRVYLAVAGRGRVTSVTVNGKHWEDFDAHSVHLHYEACPNVAQVAIGLGGATLPTVREHPAAVPAEATPDVPGLAHLVRPLADFTQGMAAAGLSGAYEVAHAQTALGMCQALAERRKGIAGGSIPALPAESQAAADAAYIAATERLVNGLLAVLRSYADSDDPAKRRIHEVAAPLLLSRFWTCIRTMGKAQSFVPAEGVWRMTIDADGEASCGWAWDFEKPLVVPVASRLVVTVRGSQGAQFFAEMTGGKDGPTFTSGWQTSPAAAGERAFDIGAGTYSRLTLYTQTRGGEVYSEFSGCRLLPGGGGAPVELLPAPDGGVR